MDTTETVVGEVHVEYTGAVEPIPKVPKSQFDAVLGALLKAQPMPLSGIPRKREPKAAPNRKAKSPRS